MATTAKADFTANFGFTLKNVPNSLDSITRTVSHNPSTISLAAGSGAGQINQIAAATIALSASTPQTLDLTAIVDDDGTTKSFSAIKYLYLWLYGADLNTAGLVPLLLGGAGSNPFAGPWNPASTVVTIQPGYPYQIAHIGAGWSVSGTSKLLKLDPGSNVVNAFLALAGLA